MTDSTVIEPAPAPVSLASVTQPFVTLWDKVKAWISGAEKEVPILLSKAEAEIVTVAAPLFQTAETEVMSDLTVFIRGVVTSHPNPGSMALPDWEAAIMNALSKLGGDLLGHAQGLGSNLLQALVGLVLHALPAA